MEDLISVIIPTYQRSEFLMRAVDSVLNQTYSALEIIIVDDNGDNGFSRMTEEAVKAAYPHEERIRYIKNARNLGGAEARNNGAAQAKGVFLCFLDDDDIYLPEKLERQHAFMIENQLDLSFTDIKMYNERDIQIDYRDHSRYIDSWENEALLRNHLLYHLTPTDAYMFRTEAFWAAGGFHTRKVSQEFMLMLSAIEKGLKIGYLPGAYAVQYIHAQGRISQGQKRVNGDKELYAVKKQYFGRLSSKDRRFIQFRFFAALAVYFMRNKQYMNGLLNLIKAFFVSPMFFFREGIVMLKTRKR